MVSSKNFSVKQVGSFWRVVGPGGKLLAGKYRRERLALQALKQEVDKFFQDRNFGFVKETSLRIEEELKRIANLEENNGWNNEQRHDECQNDEKDGKVSERYEGRHEDDEGIAIQIAKERQIQSQKRKKVARKKSKRA